MRDGPPHWRRPWGEGGSRVRRADGTQTGGRAGGGRTDGLAGGGETTDPAADTHRLDNGPDGPDGPARTTLATVLSRLHAKGLVAREPAGRGYAYASVHDAPALTARRMHRVLAAEADGDRAALLARFADRLGADDERLPRELVVWTTGSAGAPLAPTAEPTMTCMNRFTDKTVLITGGTSGIGLATARRLLDEGAYAVITGRDDARLEKAVAELGAAGDRVLAVRADAASPAELDELMRRVESWRGGLDAVFANAGVGIFKPAAELTEADVDRMLDVNVKGVFFTVQKALPLLRKGGAVVLNASWTLHRGMSVASVYSAGKAAVHNLARTLGADLAPRGIRVNSVSAGYIDTEMYRESVPDPTQHTRNAASVPLGTLGRPEDIAAAVAFLASDDAAYITGQDLIVDGGLVGSLPQNS
ncbi:glucose 1-dehydrogenase [Streptomyces sp. I05A-00742]|uniref:glucose 1-dehydrogenase n=1 Tax=Streptomyces sp. I05A-00742 TaxID=2732853 RepID=UPI0020175155|nr:glucose 1-dehydrogenase [Streptomyces sp. I05A-00742]